MDFIDILGASSEYRFRLWPERGAHVPMAGNYVVVTGERTSPTIRIIGVTHDLSRLAAKANSLEAGERLFTRLNVSRETREAVHADLVARHGGAALEVDAD